MFVLLIKNRSAFSTSNLKFLFTILLTKVNNLKFNFIVRHLMEGTNIHPSHLSSPSKNIKVRSSWFTKKLFLFNPEHNLLLLDEELDPYSRTQSLLND